jgi:anti-anti-sigma factor
VTEPTTRSSRSANAHCEVTCVVIGGESELSVRGELDLAAEQLLLSAAEDATPNVTIDLRAADFIDAAGIRAIVRAEEVCRRRGGRLRVVHPRPFQQQLLERLQLGHLVDIVDEPTSARIRRGADSST